MKLIVNGEEKETESCGLKSFLDELKVDSGTIVVEHNGDIIPRGTDRALADGDKLEIVRFVGGG